MRAAVVARFVFLVDRFNFATRMNFKLPAPIRRYPFTIAIVLVVAYVGLMTDSHTGPLRPTLRNLLGLAPRHLPRGELYRLATSVFLTPGEAAFYLVLAMLAICVGLAERRVGTWKAMLAFWGIHLATLLVQSLLLAIPTHHLGPWLTNLLLVEHDVGPSAGYYGCLGVACHKQSAKHRTWLLSVIGGILIARAVLSAMSPPGEHTTLSSDLAHLIAFPLGVALAKRM
jgi:hypothetical protein